MRDCKTVYESVCDENQTPRCRVNPRQVCQTVKAAGHESDHDPQDEVIELVERGAQSIKLPPSVLSSETKSSATKEGLKTTESSATPTASITSATTGKPYLAVDQGRLSDNSDQQLFVSLVDLVG